MEKKNMKGIIVGGGFMGKTHFDAYKNLESTLDVKITALVDQSRSWDGLANYTSLEDALEMEECDFVDICVPTMFHRDCVLQAARKGKAVLVEKPLVRHLEEMEDFLSLTDEQRGRIMVAHVCRFIGGMACAKETVASGKLGKPLSFTAFRYSETPDWSEGDWINNEALSGGTLLDLSIHDIDIANWLLGEPDEVSYREVRREDTKGAHTYSRLHYPGGAVASVEGSHLFPRGFGLQSGYTLVLEKGVLSFSNRGEEVSLTLHDEQGKQILDPSAYEYHSDPYTSEIYYFLTAVMQDSPVPVPMEEGGLAVRTVENLRRVQTS